MDNKCFAIVALPLVLSDQIKETPLFVQLINEENSKNLLIQFRSPSSADVLLDL